MPLFTPSNALTTLLVVESLLFAGFATSLSLTSMATLAISPQRAARGLALGVCGVVTIVAVGAASAWARIFLETWPPRIDDQIPAICIAIGILAQPIVAWIVVRLLYRRSPHDG